MQIKIHMLERINKLVEMNYDASKKLFKQIFCGFFFSDLKY